MTDLATPTRRVLAAATLALPLVAGAIAAPAFATDDPEAVELSTDGRSYTRSLTDLFGPTTLTPLSTAGDSFWVRNAGPTPAYLAVTATDVVVSDPLAASGLTLSAGPVGSPTVVLPFPEEGGCLTLATGELVRPGESVEIASALGLGDLDGTRGQRAHVDFALQVVLSDERMGEVGGTACGGDGGTAGPGTTGTTPGSSTLPAPGASPGGAQLPLTGTDLVALAAGAAALLVGGLVALLARRRRRADETGRDVGARS